MLRQLSLGPFLLAFLQAATRQRAHRKVAGGNSTNQRRKPPICARWQEDAWFVVGPRTTAAEIERNPIRIDGANRLEKAMSMASRILAIELTSPSLMESLLGHDCASVDVGPDFGFDEGLLFCEKRERRVRCRRT